MKSITQYTTHAIYQSSYQELHISIHLSINQSINQSISNNPQTEQIKTGKIIEIVDRLDDINESIFTFNSIELDYFPNTHFTNTHEVFVI